MEAIGREVLLALNDECIHYGKRESWCVLISRCLEIPGIPRIFNFSRITHKTRALKSWGIPSAHNTRALAHHDRNEASTRNINLKIASRRACLRRLENCCIFSLARRLSSITARSRNTGDSRDLLFCACYLSRKSGTGI